MSPGRLLWLLRRDLKRGWRGSRHFYKTLPRIEEWSWPFWSEPPRHVPVHVLTGADDWRLSAWMLASWFHASEHSWPVVIHDDGTLTRRATDVLNRLFPKCRIIRREEADAAMETALKPFPFCYEYRGMHPLALKIFDVPFFANGERYMVFDSDVLFYSYPREIIDWANARNDECWFNQDVADSTLLTEKEAQDELGVKLWPAVNSGLCLIYRPAIDFDFCDRVLAQTSVLRGHIWRVEQTLYALCASRHGKGGLLPRRYEVSLRKNSSEDIVARHYVGAVRDSFYREGLERLHRQLLADE